MLQHSLFYSTHSVLLRFLGLGGSFFELSFNGGQVDTGILGQGDQGGLSFTNDEDVAESGGEVVASGISDMDNIETTHVSVSGGQDTNSTDVITLSGEDEVTYKGRNEVSLLENKIRPDITFNIHIFCKI